MKAVRDLVFILKKLMKLLSIENLIKIYYALFNRVSTYAISAWGYAYKNEACLS